MAAYQKKLALQILEDADTDEEYQPLEIRTKVHAHKAEHNNTLSSELMSEAFRWRLSQTDCQNRGYVLDGYPKSYNTAGEVFIVTPERPPKPEPKKDEEGNIIDEEPLGDDEKAEEDKKYAPQFQKHIYPNSVVYLRGDDIAIIKREQKKGSSDEAVDSLKSRLERYKEDNDLNLFKAANTHN
jgi:adenylate kinase family enzyme